MFCPKCGTANDDGNRFCHQCSAALPTTGAQGAVPGNAPAPSAPSAKPGGRANPLKRILLVVLLLVVAFFVYAALSPDDPAPGGTDAGSSAASDTALASASGADAQAPDQSGMGDASASGNSDASGAVAAPAAGAGEEVGDILTKDVFDWNGASDNLQKNMAFACQMLWQMGGITGEAIDISSGDLARKIDAAIGNQEYVFDTACSLYEIDPTAWRGTGSN